jgi:hypothetical protein
VFSIGQTEHVRFAKWFLWNVHVLLGKARLDHTHSRFSERLIIFLFDYFAHLFHYLLSVTFCHLKAARSSLVMLSLGWLKSSRHNQSIVLLGWPLPPRGNSVSPIFQGLAAQSLWQSLRRSTQEGIGDVTFEIPPNSRVLSDATTRACIQGLTSNQVFLDPFSRTDSYGSNILSATPKVLLTRNSKFWLQDSYKAYIHVLSKGCSQLHQGQGVQKVCPTRTSPYSLRAGKNPVQVTVSFLKSDQSLKTTVGEDAELCIPIWHTGRGSGGKNVIFSNGPNSTSECSKLLY